MKKESRINLEDVRRNPKLLEKFTKQHKPKGDKECFEKLLREITSDERPGNS